ncbi:MAG TPA: hypothetical protein VFO30_02020 [Chthoniobacterales bacterium]|nr:hypothetical protein [Chthoniobacterales bacterium]
MQNEGFLLGIAQIAVTLAGFSGLVVAIRGAPPTAWHPRDIWSLSWMFGTSLGALFMALLPLLLAFFHLEAGLLWTIASLAMSAFMIVFSVAMALAGRRLTRLGHRPRVRFFPMAATFLLLICGFLSGLGGAGLFPQARIGFFILGLIACLFVSALSLVVFLVVLARAAGSRL